MILLSPRNACAVQSGTDCIGLVQATAQLDKKMPAQDDTDREQRFLPSTLKSNAESAPRIRSAWVKKS